MLGMNPMDGLDWIPCIDEVSFKIKDNFQSNGMEFTSRPIWMANYLVEIRRSDNGDEQRRLFTANARKSSEELYVVSREKNFGDKEVMT